MAVGDEWRPYVFKLWPLVLELNMLAQLVILAASLPMAYVLDQEHIP